MRAIPRSVGATALLAALVAASSCAGPPVYEKRGAQASDFHTSKGVCLERAQHVELLTDCPGTGGVSCRIRVDWQAFDACMAELGWERVDR